MKKFLFASAAAGSTFIAATAHAQSIDYGAMEQLFNEPVTTSATGSPQRATEAPADMQIISADEIRRSGETTIPGLLQRVAGVDVLNISAGHTDVNVRAYNEGSSPRLLVLVNGRQVYLDHYGMTVWSTIPVQLDEIRQIEVVKGPGSALFGFNAVSGVVNIITFNPKYDDQDVATVRVGAHGQREASLVTTFKVGSAISARISGGAAERDEWATTGASLAKPKNDPQRVNAAADVVAQLAPKTELRVEGSWANVLLNVGGGSSYADIKMVTTSEKATLTSDTSLGQIQAQLYQNQLSAKYGDSIRWENAITVASLQDLFKIGADHTIRISGEYRHNTLNVQPIAGGDVSYDVWSGSAMWNWAINDTLTTTAAVRYDNLQLARKGAIPAGMPGANTNSAWDQAIDEPSLNLTAAWKPTALDTFRASFARGIQAPSLVEFGGLLGGVSNGPNSVFITGNPNIRPTIVTNYELAYDHSFKAAKVGVRLFQQDWKDLKSGSDLTQPDYLPTATTGLSYIFSNVGGSKMKGVELTASGKLAGDFGWHADYTYTDVEDSLLPGINAEARQAAFESTSPKSRGNVGGYWARGPWEVDANLHYVGDYQFYAIPAGGALQPVKAYASLSSRVGYRMDNGVTLALSGQNLLQERQNQTGNLRAERQLVASISKAW
jgi:outer membrane receptor for ferrienterochelin and colicins